MLQRVNVNAVLCLYLARLECLMNDVKLSLLDKTLPVLFYLLADNLTVHSHLIRSQLTFTLMFILVDQTARDVADFLRLQAVDDPNFQQDASAHPTAGIAVEFLQLVVLLVLTCLWVVSHLRLEIHTAKISIILLTAVFYNVVLDSFRS